MKLTPNQIEKLKEVMDRYTITFLAHNVGKEVLSDDDLKRLKSWGFSMKDIKDSSSSVTQAFKFGMLSDFLGDQVVKHMTFDQLLSHIETGKAVKLNQNEQAMLDVLKLQTAAAVRHQANNMKNDLDTSLVTIQKNQAAIHSPKVLNLADQVIRDRKGVAQLKSLLGEHTKQWDRNIGRMAGYVLHSAFNQGRASMFERKDLDTKVYFDVYPGACNHCIRVYLTAGIMSPPKIFTVRELRLNGSNVGRKVEDWKATLDPVHPNCYDDKTEVLTDQGWKLFSELNKTELFLSVNLENGEGEWKSAVKYLNLPYKGPIHVFKNKNFDLVTTPNHSHVINTYSQKKLRLVSTDKLPIEAKFLRHMPIWKGNQDIEFVFDGIEFDQRLMFEFMGYYISEGCIVNYRNMNRIHISQSKQKYYDEIYECMSKLFGKVYKCDGYLQVNLKQNQIEIVNFLSLGKSYDKFIPSILKQGSCDLIEIFLQAFCKGDGSFRKGRDWDGYQCKDSREYFTSSKKLADDLGEMILKIKRTPSYKFKEPIPVFDKKRGKFYTSKHGMYLITETTNLFCQHNTMSHTTEGYDGYIYDVELESNHTLFVRRNGKVCVSGNCRCTIAQIPTGYEWNQDSLSFDKPAEFERKVKRTSKVRVTVNGETTEI
jgi:hypothetical protein